MTKCGYVKAKSMGTKFSVLNSGDSNNPHAVSNGNEIEVKEEDIIRTTVVTNHNTGTRTTEVEHQDVEPEALYPSYQPVYAMDYINNVAVENYQNNDVAGGLPLESYDEDDDVFDRGANVGNVGYVYAGNPPSYSSTVPNTYAGNIPGYTTSIIPGYPGIVPGYASMVPGYGDGAHGYYNIYYPPVPPPQRDIMRYVECLQDGMLAVWGDDDSPDFNSQFSRSASIYCYTDTKDTSMVVANRMTPHALVQNNTNNATTHNVPNRTTTKTGLQSILPKKIQKKIAKKSKSKSTKTDSTKLDATSDGKSSCPIASKVDESLKTEIGDAGQNATINSMEEQSHNQHDDQPQPDSIDQTNVKQETAVVEPETGSESNRDNARDIQKDPECDQLQQDSSMESEKAANVDQTASDSQRGTNNDSTESMAKQPTKNRVTSDTETSTKTESAEN